MQERHSSGPFRPIVVAPTFNNAGTLNDLLVRLDRLGLPVIVVNDGSTDETASILEAWVRAGGGRRSSNHESNCGKAMALRTGFGIAVDEGYTHAVTIDTDGQHDPEEIPHLLTIAKQNPRALVLGWRNERIPGYPNRNRLGRRLSNWTVWLECGRHVYDSQSGFRVYPMGLLQSIRCQAERYGFEIELITRAAWADWPIEQVAIMSRYLPLVQRVSHFRPALDTFRHLAMHARLMLQAPIQRRRLRSRMR